MTASAGRERQGGRLATQILCRSSQQLPLDATKEPFFFYWQHFQYQHLPSLHSLLWFELVTFQSQAGFSNLHTTNNPVWPSLWTTGLVDKYRLDTTSHGSVCKWIDCNNLRQLLVDSVLKRQSRQSRTATAACRKHFLNRTLIWFWDYRELFVWGIKARHTYGPFISAQCCYITESNHCSDAEVDCCVKNTLI